MGSFVLPRTWLVAAVVCAAAYLVAVGIAGRSVAAESPASSSMFFGIERGGQQTVVRECVGLGTASEVTEFRDGSSPDAPPRLLPGRVKQIRVTCQRGVSNDTMLADWRAQVLADFPAARSQVEVRLFDQSGQPVAHWRLQNAWPAEVTVGLGTETVSLVAEALTRVN